jgi:GWxTD domain-containing protein
MPMVSLLAVWHALCFPVSPTVLSNDRSFFFERPRSDWEGNVIGRQQGAHFRNSPGAAALLAATFIATMLVAPTADSQAERQEVGKSASFVAWIDAPVNLLLTAEEAAIARRLEPLQYERFLEWFWARRDPRPETERNEFRELFYSRLLFADKEFSDRQRGTPGWATSRGLFFVLLGPPDAVYRTQARLATSAGFRHAEVWDYQRRSQLRVMFVDMGDYMALADEHDVRSAAQIRRALAEAVNGAVRNHELTLEVPSTLRRMTAVLPVTAVVTGEDTGLTVELTFAIEDLRGELVDGALVSRLDLRVLGAPAAGVGERSGAVELAASNVSLVADEPEAPATSGAIAMRLRLDPAELAELAREPVRVLVRLAPEYTMLSGAATLEVAEAATGRVARFPLAAAPDAAAPEQLPNRYAVARLLSVNVSGDGRAVAIAFIANDPAAGDRVLWLQRRSLATAGEPPAARSAAGTRFWLLPVAAPCPGCAGGR